MRILCLGDSIMQYNDFSTYPQTGWVQELARFFPRGVEFLNFARNGRSTKSFIAEGRLDFALSAARAGDFALVQFGHNDEKTADPTRYTDPAPGGEFRRNLSVFVERLRGAGCRPVLLTPMARRKFSGGVLEDTHGAYTAAIRKTAAALGVPCIDMAALSFALLERTGAAASRRFFMNFGAGEYDNFPDGRDDNSHLRPDGAFAVSRIAAAEIAKIGAQFPEYAELSAAVLTAGATAADSTGRDRDIDDEFMMFIKK